MAAPPRADLSAFHELNAKGKVPWSERYALICKEFPQVDNPDWIGLLQDQEIAGRILRDILNSAQPIGNRRSGPRPPLELEAGSVSFRQLFGRDFATDGFIETFNGLAGERSRAHLARKVGLSKTQTHRLLKGEIEPGRFELESIAKAFGRDPGYFREYRLMVITAAVVRELERNPERSIILYRALTEAA